MITVVVDYSFEKKIQVKANKNMNNSSEMENHNFFAGLIEWDWIKVVYIIFHILLTIIVPTLLYSIYWYERYSPDLQYRMVTNIVLSHTCWIGILRSIFSRIPAVILFIGGPYSYTTCNIFISLARFFFVIFLNELAIWQFVRFVYIAKGANLTIMEDDLIAFYLTLCNVFLSAILIFTAATLSFQITEIDYHICTGVDPYQNILKLKQMPWFDKDMELIPLYNKLIYADPVGLLFRIEFSLVLFFTTVSYCITNKDMARFFILMSVI